MRITQGSTLQSLRAVQNFIDAHADALGGVPTSGAKKTLDDIVANFDASAQSQVSSHLESLSATFQHQALRSVLNRDHMAPIDKIARAELPDAPGIEVLRLPSSYLTAEKLKAAAYGMASAAEPYTEVFTNAGLPADFAKQLTDAADAMLATYTGRRQRKAVRRQATIGLRNLSSQGRRAVHVLNALIRSALKDDPTLTETWERTKRVQLVGSRNTPATPVASPAAAPADSASAPDTTPVEKAS